MKKYKVTCDKGVLIGDKHFKQGETFLSESKSAHVQTALHFGQIKEISEKESAKEPAKAEKESAKEPAK